MFFKIEPKWLQGNPDVPQVISKWSHRVQKWPSNDPKVSKSAPAHSDIIFPGALVALLTPQNSLEKWVYAAYGPVWVGHKAIWYALQVPFDVYMPLLGSIFHFPAIVFHYFHENWPQSDSKLTPKMH